MIKEKIKKLKPHILRIRFLHMKKMKCDLNILKFCVKHMDRICIPTNEKENEVMKKLLAAYDEAIGALNESVNIYRKRVVE